MRIHLLSFFTLLCGIAARPQSSALKDSLFQVLKNAPEDTSRVQVLLAIQKLYSTSNFDSSYYYLNAAEALATKLKTDKFDYTINNKYSIYYYFNNNFEKSLEYAMKTKEIAEKQNDLKLQARVCNNISGIYNHFNQPKNAVEYTLKCLDLAEKAGDSTNFSNYNISASETYGHLRQLDKAVMYAKKGIEYGKKFSDLRSVTNGLNNLSVMYAQMNKLDSAVIINKEQLQLAKEQQDVVVTNYALVNLCFNSFRNGNAADVSRYAAELKMAIKNLPDEQLSPEANTALAFDYIGQRQYSQASAELDKGITVAASGNNSNALENLYNAYTVLYYLQGNIRAAELYRYKSDSVVSVRNLEELNAYAQDLETKYQTEKKEAQIQLQQEQLKRKTTINYILVGGAAALLLILLLTYRNYRNRQKLQRVKIAELETEKQLTAAEGVLKGEEQERTRLAKDLHDGLGGMLSGIKYSLTTIKGNLILPAEQTEAFERSIQMLDSSINEMRRVAHNMMPEVLLKYGLDASLREFCDEINRSGAATTTYQSIDASQVSIEQTTAVAVYRIVQELVNNAIKHADATTILVQAHYIAQDRLLAVTVEDNGKGFDINALPESAGMGWINIRNRVDFLRGRLDISSKKGQGTSVLIEVNL